MSVKTIPCFPCRIQFRSNLHWTSFFIGTMIKKYFKNFWKTPKQGLKNTSHCYLCILLKYQRINLNYQGWRHKTEHNMKTSSWLYAPILKVRYISGMFWFLFMRWTPIFFYYLKNFYIHDAMCETSTLWIYVKPCFENERFWNEGYNIQ